MGEMQWKEVNLTNNHMEEIYESNCLYLIKKIRVTKYSEN